LLLRPTVITTKRPEKRDVPVHMKFDLIKFHKHFRAVTRNGATRFPKVSEKRKFDNGVINKRCFGLLFVYTSKFLMAAGVSVSLRCLVVYRRALRRPSVEASLKVFSCEMAPFMLIVDLL